MVEELTTATSTEEGGTDGAVCVRERVRNRDKNISPAAIVVTSTIACSLPPPVRVAVTVMEYSVPSSRPVSLYIVSLPAMSGIMVLEPGIHSVSVAE